MRRWPLSLRTQRVEPHFHQQFVQLGNEMDPLLQQEQLLGRPPPHKNNLGGFPSHHTSRAIGHQRINLKTPPSIKKTAASSHVKGQQPQHTNLTNTFQVQQRQLDRHTSRASGPQHSHHFSALQKPAASHHPQNALLQEKQAALHSMGQRLPAYQSHKHLPKFRSKGDSRLIAFVVRSPWHSHLSAPQGPAASGILISTYPPPRK
jgi:hypothetical protein